MGGGALTSGNVSETRPVHREPKHEVNAITEAHTKFYEDHVRKMSHETAGI